jgi:lipopolysaccharide/colanic/teichoic acid biosynthesis glycosyltransferase
VAGLPVLALGVLIMTAVTRLVSPGPVLYKQERVGHRGRRFMIYKFRTMKVSADPGEHAAHVRGLIAGEVPMTKLDRIGDNRMIPGGKVLRASGLDELPQLLNVWLGEMSMVGPRPCLPGEFEALAAEQRRRVEALPGLTGLWQVSGKNRTTFREMVRLDVAYAERLSPRLDLEIVLRTPWVLTGQLAEMWKGRRAAAPAVGPKAGPEPLRSFSVLQDKS